MKLIPQSAFIMGSDWEPFYGTIIPESVHARRDEVPMEVVPLKGYWIDTHPVTNREYALFVEATGTPPPRHWKGQAPPTEDTDLPVVNVSFESAQAYAAWASKRLPTEAEWEKAARGVDGRLYPWGNEFSLERCSSVAKEEKSASLEETPLAHIEPVGHRPDGASPYGVEEMAGNVWEWTTDAYQPYPNNPFRRRVFNAQEMVIRGGSWKEVLDRTAPLYFRCANRWHVPHHYTANNLGFRCVRDLTPDETARQPRPVDAATLQQSLIGIKKQHLKTVTQVASHAAFRDASLGSIIIGIGIYAFRSNASWGIGFTIIAVGLGLLGCTSINTWRTLRAKRRLRQFREPS